MLKLHTTLYELAMNIGNSFDLVENANSFVKVLVKRLSCKGALLFKDKVLIYKFPKKIDFECLLDNLNDEFKEFKRGEYFFYVYRLQDFGYFVFFRSKELDEEVKKALFPIMQKFSNSLISCELYEKTKEALKKAEIAQKAKMQFLANMSHEIRTPLNGIIGFTNILLKKDLDEEIRKIIKTIDASSRQLLKIVNEILDISKIENKGVELVYEEFDPFYEFESVTKLFEAKALEKNLKYYVFIDPKLPVKIKGDRFRLKQVLSNLINNAIKFTEEGEIYVFIGLKNITKHSCEIFFSVKDTGIGIPKDKQQKIFEMFSQVSEAINRKYEGTGLGLAIAYKIVEAMGGKLKVKSQINKGSEFYFSLKFDIVEITNEIKDRLNDLEILIYEKDLYKCIIELLNKYLSSIARVEFIKEIDEVIISSKKYDAIFVCESVYEEVKALNLNFPIIVIGDRGEYHINYPFNVSDIFNIFLKLKGISKELIKKEEVKNLNLTGKILIAEDNEINQELLKEFLKLKGDFEIKIANNGKEAIDLAKKEKFDLIFMDIHMPIVSGLGAIQSIRYIDLNKSTPIIALTANALKGDRERFLESGFDDYIPKPFEESELDRILSKYLKVKKTSSNKKSTLPPQLLNRLQEMFKKNVFKDLDELKKAFNTKDIKNIVFFSHKIKGAAKSIGYDEIAEISKEIELLGRENKIEESLLIKLENLIKGLQ